MPAALKLTLEDSTQTAQRALNAEIIARLEASFVPRQESFVANASVTILSALIAAGQDERKNLDADALADSAVAVAKALTKRLRPAGAM